jgi:integrase
VAKRARNGQGSISSRTLADGTVVWDAKVSVKDPVTQQTSRPSVKGLPSETDAVEWVQTQRAAKTRNVKAMTLDDLAEMFWQAETVKVSTLSYWKADYARDIKPYLGAMPISDILPLHIDTWVAKIRAKEVKGKRRKAASLIKYKTVLAAILEYGVTNRFLDANWVDASPAAKKLSNDAANEEVGEKEVWTVQQFLDFLEMEPEPSYKAMWCFMAATGVRRGTACGLQWSEVNFDKGVILAGTNYVPSPEGNMFVTQKGGRKIKIRMDETLANVLLTQQDRQEKAKAEGPWEDHGVVFDRPLLTSRYKGEVFVPGRPMDPKSVTERFSRIARYAENPPASPHGLRHMWATLARDAGASRDAVGDILGHKSKAVTKLYDHSEKEQTELASNMAKLVIPS